MRRKRFDNELSSQLSYTNKNVEYDITRNSKGYTQSNPKYKRYYSQIDANVWFGDKLVSDIQNIAYNLAQHDMPIFGYNSYIYDEIAIGNRIVQGAFTINFTSPRYIEDIIEKYKSASIVNEDTTKIEEYNEIIKPLRTSTNVHKNPDHDSIWKNGFEIDITYGEDDNIMGDPIHVILLDCHIMNVQTVLDSSGRPILEQYQFIARDRKLVM